MKHVLIVFALLIVPASARAQDANTKAAQAQFDMIKLNLSKTAAKVPDDLYAFKPTPEVRSVGQLIAHVAFSNFVMCAAVAGDAVPSGDLVKGKTSKADLAKVLDDSIAYCDKAIAALDDVKAAQGVPFPPLPGLVPKLAVVHFAVAHCNEHYGNLVTYMRLKGIVPPSSEPTP